MRAIFTTIGVALGLLMSGCGITYWQIEQPLDGFEAIKFRKSVSIEDHVGNIYFFGAGVTMIGDHYTEQGPLYCGPATGAGVSGACVGFEAPNTIVIGPTAGFKEVRRTIPLDSFVRLKVKL